MENFHHFSRQIEVPEEGCNGEPGTVRPALTGLQTKNCFPLLPPAARRAWSNGEALVAKGEIPKAGQTTGAPRFYFTIFMYFMVRLYLPFFVSC